MGRTALQLIAYAMDAGLAPHTYLEYGRPVTRGAVRVIIDGTGMDSPFGVFYVGAQTGRVLRGSITYGNEGPRKHYTGARAMQAALRTLANRNTDRKG